MPRIWAVICSRLLRILKCRYMSLEQPKNPFQREASAAHGLDLASIRELSVNPKDPMSIVLLHYGFKAFAHAVLAHEALTVIESGSRDLSRIERRFLLKEPLSFMLSGVAEAGFVVPKAALKISGQISPSAKRSPARVELCAASLLKPLLNPSAANVSGSITPAAATLPPNFLKLTWSKNDLLDRAKMGAAFRAAELLFNRSLARFKQHEDHDSFSNGALSELAAYLAVQMEELSKGPKRQVSLGMGSNFLLALRPGFKELSLPPIKIPDFSDAHLAPPPQEPPPSAPPPTSLGTGRTMGGATSWADAFAALQRRIGSDAGADSHQLPRKGKLQLKQSLSKGEFKSLEQLENLEVRLCHPDVAKRVDARAELLACDTSHSPRVEAEVIRLNRIVARVDREESSLQLVRMLLEDGKFGAARSKLEVLLSRPAQPEADESELRTRYGLLYLRADAERLAGLLSEVLTSSEVVEAPTMVWPSADGSMPLYAALQMAFWRGAEAEVFTDKGHRLFGRLGCYMSQEPELVQRIPEFLLVFSESAHPSRLIYDVDFSRYYIGADELKNLDKITEGLLAGLERYGDPKKSDERMRHEAERFTFRVPLDSVTKIKFYVYKGPTPQEVRAEIDRRVKAEASLRTKEAKGAEEARGKASEGEGAKQEEP